MRVDIALAAAASASPNNTVTGQQITVEGWLINASHKGMGQLFYMVEDKLHMDDTRRSILVVRAGNGSSPAERVLADGLDFIAPYGRLSPLEARITGTVDCVDTVFPLSFTQIDRVEVSIPKWGYSGYYIPQGIDYEMVGVGKLSPIAVFDLLKNKDMFIGARIKLEGILTGMNATHDNPEMCYITDRRYLATPPALEPVLADDKRVTQEFMLEMQNRQKQRRNIFDAKLVRERRNSVIIKYTGILRKIIRPHYSGRAFFENAILIGTLDAADIAPFPVALVNPSTLLIKNMKNEKNSVQIWDLNAFPYGNPV